MPEPVDSSHHIPEIEQFPNDLRESHFSLWGTMNYYISLEYLNEKNKDVYLSEIKENIHALEPALKARYKPDQTLTVLRRIAETPESGESREVVLKVITDNIELIKEQISPLDLGSSLGALQVVNTLWEHGDDVQRDIAENVLRENVSLIVNGFDEKSPYRYGYISLLAPLAVVDDKKHERWAVEKMQSLFTNKDFETENVAQALGIMIKKDYTEGKVFAWQAVGKYLKRLGLDSTDVMAHWGKFGGLPRNVQNNIPHIAWFEEKSPGIVRFAYEALEVNTFGILYNDLIYEEYNKYKEKGEQGLDYTPWEVEKRILRDWGLDADQLFSSWRKGNPELLPAVAENIFLIKNLENQGKGQAKVLNEEFGIEYFGRYPAWLLEKQYKERDVNMPYGVILYPRNDYNGAFTHNRIALAQLGERLGTKYALRILECESKHDIARALIKLKKRYGDQHKISFAVVGGHGSESSIQFGGTDERHRLHANDLAGKGVKRTSEFFEPDPTLILVSCSTGVDKGIGEQLSDLMGAKVIAPKTPTNIKSIDITFTANHPDFQVEYFEEGATNVFAPKTRVVS